MTKMMRQTADTASKHDTHTRGKIYPSLLLFFIYLSIFLTSCQCLFRMEDNGQRLQGGWKVAVLEMSRFFFSDALSKSVEQFCV